MKANLSKAEIESALTKRFGNVTGARERLSIDSLSTGIAPIDEQLNGFPRSSITEIIGGPSSGRTSLLLSVLAQASWSDEVCALIDTADRFDPASGAVAGIALDRLLWVRCANDLERAFKAADLVLQSGGFGLVMLDIGDVATQFARKIISSWWYRFHRTIEHTPTALIVISQTSCVRSCASVSLELKSVSHTWMRTPRGFERTIRKTLVTKERPGQGHLVLVSEPERRCDALAHSLLLHGTDAQIEQVKPVVSTAWAEFQTYASTHRFPA